MKQTAVEWLYQEITKKSVNDQSHNILSILEQAKEMEKQQIVDTHNNGKNVLPPNENGEQYYNETYKNK